MNQDIITLYDEYARGGMDRRAFLDRLAQVVGGAAAALALRIDQFLSSRGFQGTGVQRNGVQPVAASAQPSPDAPVPVSFVCEDDVRTALKTGQSIFIHERTIVTPAARELGDAHRVLVQAPGPPATRAS